MSTSFSSTFQSPSFPSPFLLCQHAKKVVSDSPGLVDFAIELVIFTLNLLNGQVLFFGEIQIKDCNQSSQSKRVLGLVKMTCELVHPSYSWPEWQAVKLSLHPVCSTSLSFPILFSPNSNKVCSISFQSILFSVLKDLSTVFFFQLLTWTSQGKSTPLKRTPSN